MKKTVLIIGEILLVIIALISMYFICAFWFSRITINGEKNTKKDVVIYIKTNGAHTDIVMPVCNKQMDWSKEIKYSNTISKDTNYEYLAIGWGDKGFYLDIPTWNDLTLPIAFKALFWLGTTAMHTTYYTKIEEAASCKKILISEQQYSRLIKYIINTFQKDTKGHFININTKANYGKSDAFYEAKGRYNLFFTCNTWANRALRIGGQKSCLWTPFDTGIFLQYK